MQAKLKLQNNIAIMTSQTMYVFHVFYIQIWNMPFAQKFSFSKLSWVASVCHWLRYYG